MGKMEADEPSECWEGDWQRSGGGGKALSRKKCGSSRSVFIEVALSLSAGISLQAPLNSAQDDGLFCHHIQQDTPLTRYIPPPTVPANLFKGTNRRRRRHRRHGQGGRHLGPTPLSFSALRAKGNILTSTVGQSKDRNHCRVTEFLT